MKRYLNSFFITSFLYSMVGAIFLYAMSEIKIEPKKEEIITKISLNSVAVQKIEKKIVEPIIEQKPEPVIEKIVEKPAPKVIEKTKKVEKVVKKEKPIEKIVEKPVEKVAEKTEKSIEENPVVTQTTPNTNPVIESISKAQIDSIEDAYLSKVKAKIEKNKVYPKIAKRLNQTGKVVISFDILKDGKVINIRIIQNSKFEKLDEASIELLTKIGFFEAIPNELNKTVWNIQIPINYQIN